jgi:hypothetical protein
MMRRRDATLGALSVTLALACIVPIRVSAEGCVDEPAGGACWTTRSVLRVAASASVDGRSVRCTLECEVAEPGALLLFDDGTYRVPSGRLAECPTGDATTFPDEVGTTGPARGRRMVLEPTNLDELFAAAAECFGEANPFRAYHAQVRPSADGTTLRGRARLRGRVPGRIPVRLRVVARLTGASLASGLEPPPPSRRTLPACSPDLTPKCRTL